MNEPHIRPDTKQVILTSAFKLFRKEGYGRVSVDAIAAEANVTKRTVYYHFPSKDDILTQVLDSQHLSDMANFQEWVGDEQLTPVAFVELLFDRMIDWASGKDWLGSGFTRIAMELAHLHGHPARKSTSQYKAAIESWIALQLADQTETNPEQLARQIMVLIEGSMCLALIHGDTSYMVSAYKAAKTLVGSHC